MKNLYHFIIDQSGSMSDCHRDTVTAINEQFASLRQLETELQEDEFKSSLDFFNNRYSNFYFNKSPRELRDLAHSDYIPNGCTALLDAIGGIATKERRYSSEWVLTLKLFYIISFFIYIVNKCALIIKFRIYFRQGYGCFKMMIDS